MRRRASGRGLPAGTYYARTADRSDHLDELYDDIPCVWGACTVTGGTPIVVAPGATTSGTDFGLDPAKELTRGSDELQTLAAGDVDRYVVAQAPWARGRASTRPCCGVS